MIELPSSRSEHFRKFHQIFFFKTYLNILPLRYLSERGVEPRINGRRILHRNNTRVARWLLRGSVNPSRNAGRMYQTLEEPPLEAHATYSGRVQEAVRSAEVSGRVFTEAVVSIGCRGAKGGRTTAAATATGGEAEFGNDIVKIFRGSIFNDVELSPSNSSSLLKNVTLTKEIDL